MRHFSFFIIPIMSAAAVLFTACEERPGSDGLLTLNGEEQMTLPAAQTDTIVSFSATAAWTVRTEGGDWLSIAPDGGAAGDFEAVLSARANSDTSSRTATLTFLCGTSETILTVTQNGVIYDGPAGPDEPAAPEGSLIKTITVTGDGGNDTYVYSFTYDGDSRVVSIEGTNTYQDGYDEMTDRYLYGITYLEGSIEISGEGGDYGETYIETMKAMLDGDGRAMSMDYSSIDDEGNGYTHETEVHISFSYDASGRLVKESGTEYGYQDFYTDYTWTGGDLTGSYNSSEYYNAEYTYSGYANTGNIDINWILSGGYSSWASPLGIIGVLGVRSGHYVWPDMWDYAYPDSNIGVDYPIHQDLIGTTFERSYTRYASGEPEVTYSFIPAEGSEDGLLSSIVKSIPQYSISYTQTYRYVLEDPSVQPEDDGYYYYGVGLEPVGEPVETGRETLEPEVTEVTIGY